MEKKNKSLWVIVKGQEEGIFAGMDKGYIATFFPGTFLPLKGSVYTRYYKSKGAAQGRITSLTKRGYNTSDWSVKEIPVA